MKIIKLDKSLLKEEIESINNILIEYGAKIEKDYWTMDDRSYNKAFIEIGSKYPNISQISTTKLEEILLGKVVMSKIEKTKYVTHKQLKVALQPMVTYKQLDIILDKALQPMVTKDELKEALKPFVTKVEFKLELNQIRKDMVTKAELIPINESLLAINATLIKMNERMDKHWGPEN
ncbi:MAG: hypothetical protein LBS76_01990 [Mycoplasmataceae bacterium]|nr:hypothetical protein [Mycoplasmataceae bacterium]